MPQWTLFENDFRAIDQVLNALLEKTNALSVHLVDRSGQLITTSGRSADFDATAYHHVPTVTFASAVHVAQVEVDPESGAVRLLRYVVAHDCGTVINPMIVEGQVHGGVAQGVGGALFEEMAYDEDGQLLSGTLMDYVVPRADDLPWIDCVHLEYPSPRNPLGAKGLGEGGAISPPAPSPTRSTTRWPRWACASPRRRRCRLAFAS